MLNDSPHDPHRDDMDEQEERWQSSRAQHRVHFVTGFLLVLVIAGLAWYAYPILQRLNASVKDLPPLSERVGALGEQVKQTADGAEQKLSQWSHSQAAEHKSLREDTARVANDLKSRIETVSRQAHDSAEEMLKQVRAEFGEKMDGVTTRVATLETSRDGDQKQIAALQQQLSDMQGKVTDEAAELAAVRRQVQDTGDNARERIATLKQDQDSTRHDVGVIENKLAVDKVPFEASTGHIRELSEGISLNVSSTDPTYRRADGWLWVAADRRNIWLRNLAAQEPLTFYGYQDGRKRELVITNVSKSGVTGYLLLPKESAASGRAEAAAGQ